MLVASCSKKRGSKTVLIHILVHFWVVRKPKIASSEKAESSFSSGTTDETELEVIRYHGAGDWGVKRARDLMKAKADASMPVD